MGSAKIVRSKVSKCVFCDRLFEDIDAYALHLEQTHSDQMPPDMCGHQYIYFLRTGKTHGECIIDKADTTWNTKTNKYNRLCNNPKCKEKYIDQFRRNMIGKYGKIMLLNDPEQQKKMLANRKISGEYTWSDGSNVKTYTGTYELDFLKFLDLYMNFDADDVFTPSPHTYYYEYDKQQKFYIPDVFIMSLNLEIEIKDGGDNPNMHGKIQAVDKVKEKLKDDVMRSNQSAFNYLKIVNKNNRMFLDYLDVAKQQFKDGIDRPIFMI